MTGSFEEALGHAVKVLRAYGYGATADLAEQKALATELERSVVVVGEVKRGKSSLVNALLGVADAAPVDVGVATSAALHFVTASDSHPAGFADLVFPGEIRRIPVAELHDWVTHTGRHVQDPGIDALPTRAVVSVANSRLPDAVVIDTPGAGGLDAAHAQLALRSAQQACVLVVVTDASTPLTAPEMSFVRDAAATVESVLVVVTKTDKNLRRWRSIVDENRRLLTEHLQRDIPVLAVSSVRALAPNGDDISGVAELRAVITSSLDRDDHRGAIDGLRTALEGLRRVTERIDTDITLARDGDKSLPDLTRQRDALQELKDHSAQWEMHLARDLTFARQAALTHLDTQLDGIRVKWTDRINKSGLTVLRQHSQVFTQEIETDLMSALAGTVELFLDRVQQITVPLFDEPDVVWADIRHQVIGTLTRPDKLSAGEVVSKRQDLLDPGVLTMGMIGTSMLGALVGVGAVAGVVWVGVNLAYKAMRAGKHNLVAWLRETLGVTRTAATRMLELSLTTSRTEIVLRYREQLRSRIADVQTQLDAAQKASRVDAASRDRTLERLTKNKRIVAARIAELDALIAASAA